LIDLETSLLELLDWDEELLELVYQRVSSIISDREYKTRQQVELQIKQDLEGLIPEDGIKIVISILDQLIRKEERIAIA
jgi:hypothetical protein